MLRFWLMGASVAWSARQDWARAGRAFRSVALTSFFLSPRAGPSHSLSFHFMFHIIFHVLFHLILQYWGNIPMYPLKGPRFCISFSIKGSSIIGG